MKHVFPLVLSLGNETILDSQQKISTEIIEPYLYFLFNRVVYEGLIHKKYHNDLNNGGCFGHIISQVLFKGQ
jgi:hypothetical protein